MKRAIRLIVWTYLIGVVAFGVLLLIGDYTLGLFHSPSDVLRSATRSLGTALLWALFVSLAVAHMIGLIALE
jgi:Na+-driven multidrug efflux pump